MIRYVTFYVNPNPKHSEDLMKLLTLTLVILTTISASSIFGMARVHPLGKEFRFTAAASDLNKARALLDQGVPVDFEDYAHWTALMDAIEKNDLAMVLLLISYHANVNYMANTNITPLGQAIGRGNVAIAEALLRADAGVNQLQFKDGSHEKTPLEWAIGDQQSDMVELLLKYGADANRQNKAGENALVFAKRNLTLMESQPIFSDKKRENGSAIVELLEKHAPSPQPAAHTVQETKD